jgi:hypothetical protein
MRIESKVISKDINEQIRQISHSRRLYVQITRAKQKRRKFLY